MSDIKKLRKEINGKRVWWSSPVNGHLVEAVCIFPPDSPDMSIKPIDTPIEVSKVITWRSIRELSRPSYCLVTIQEGAIDYWEGLMWIANVPDGCVLRKPSYVFGVNPSCPHV